MPTALITGIGSQDGHYLAEFLNQKSYDIFGIIDKRHQDSSDIAETLPYVVPMYGDLGDLSSLIAVYRDVQPDEIYNLGSNSEVDLSLQIPVRTLEVVGVGVLNALEAFRISGCQERGARFFQASSAEMFGNAGPGKCSEQTPFNPQSPYAAAKVLGHHLCNIYRHSYSLYISTGILFSHESPRRRANFVSRKISLAAARIAAGHQSVLKLGNLDSRRDWGYAGDYVAAMWMSLQQPIGDDYVIATGELRSVRELVELAFARAGVRDWQRYVVQDEIYLRPFGHLDVRGDSTKARAALGWEPSVNFSELVAMMVDADLATTRTT